MPTRPITGPLTRSPSGGVTGVGGLRGRINFIALSDRPPHGSVHSSPEPSLNSEAAPDGSLTAWKYLAGSTVYEQGNITIPADVRPYVYTMRVKALASGARVLMPTFGISGVSGQTNGISNAYYDFDSNSFGTSAADWYATPDSNGYVLLRRLFVNNGAGTVFAHRIDTDATYTNAKVAFAWHQLEVGNTPTAYQRTTATGAASALSTFPLARAHVSWGDSLTNGDGDTLPGGYVTRLNAARQFIRHMGGASGETSTQIKTRVLADTQGRNSWINLFWMGNNNPSAPATVAADVAACVSNLYAGNDRYLVFSLLKNAAADAPTKANVDTINAGFASTYGGRYLDVAAYLMSKGDGGVNDNADIAAGLVPRSLRVDNIHLNGAGYQHVADCVKARLDSFGW